MNSLQIILLVISVLLAALVLLARWKQTYPLRPLVMLVIVPACLGAGIDVDRYVARLALVANFALLGLAIIDLLTLPRPDQFAVQRDTLRVASLRKPHPVALTLVNRGKRTESIWIRDGVPPPLAAEPDELLLRLAPRSRATLRYQLRATRRGAFTLNQVHLRVRSRLGLWQRFLDFPVKNLIHVYPDMKQLGEYTVLARTNRLSLLGCGARAKSARTTNSNGSAISPATTITNTSIGAALPGETS